MSMCILFAILKLSFKHYTVVFQYDTLLILIGIASLKYYYDYLYKHFLCNYSIFTYSIISKRFDVNKRLNALYAVCILTQIHALRKFRCITLYFVIGLKRHIITIVFFLCGRLVHYGITCNDCTQGHCLRGDK